MIQLHLKNTLLLIRVILFNLFGNETLRITTLEEEITTVNYELVSNIYHFLKSPFSLMSEKCLDKILKLKKRVKKKK